MNRTICESIGGMQRPAEGLLPWTKGRWGLNLCSIHMFENNHVIRSYWFQARRLNILDTCSIETSPYGWMHMWFHFLTIFSKCKVQHSLEVFPSTLIQFANRQQLEIMSESITQEMEEGHYLKDFFSKAMPYNLQPLNDYHIKLQAKSDSDNVVLPGETQVV